MSKKRLYNCAGKLHSVSEKQYKEFKTNDNHSYYIKQFEKDTAILSFDALDDDEFLGENIVIDYSVDVEEEVINNIMLEKLKKSLTKLSDDELYLIEQLIYNEKSERELSAISGIPQRTINDRKHRILAKLKKLLEN